MDEIKEWMEKLFPIKINLESFEVKINKIPAFVRCLLFGLVFFEASF